MISFEELKPENINIITQLMTDFYAIDNYPIDIEVTKRNFEYFIQQPQLGQIFEIHFEKEIVGYILFATLFSFEFGGTIAFLDELYISEKMRGKGLGKMAVEFAKNFAKEQDYKVLYLEVEPHNEKAQELYKKSNFESHHRGLMIYKNEQNDI